MATILGFLGLVNLGLDTLPSPKERESLSKKMEVEDNVDTFNKLNKDWTSNWELLYKKKGVEDKIDTAAVTVADAIWELEFKLGGKSK